MPAPRRGLRIIRGLAAAGALAVAGPAARAQVSAQDLKTLDAVGAELNRVTAAAERVCLASYTKTQQKSFLANLSQGWVKLVAFGSLGASAEQKEQIVRSSARDLPKSLWSIQDDKVRKCMQERVDPAFVNYARAIERITGVSGLAEISFRFAFQRSGPLDRNRFTDRLVLHATTPSRQVKNWISVQDPTGIPYFVQDFAYPAAGKPIKGWIAPEAASSALGGANPALTSFCVERAPAPPPTGIDYDHFQCVEGKDCRPSTQSTKMLRLCPAPAIVQANPPARVWRASHRLQPGGAEGAAAQKPTWNVPSLEALIERKGAGTGYTIFRLETDAFKNQPAVTSVEVGLRVNGITVNEDGVPPEYRPVGNRAGEAFNYSFALQTLNFDGARRGCEDVEVSLTPLLEDGGKGRTSVARLDYVAFRDVAPRPAAGGVSGLTWSASYIRPAEAWRNMLILNSYTFTFEKAGAREAAIAKVQADKVWLDAKRFVFNGQQVVGAIRPPRTLQPNGSAAYGLMAALRQPSGQLRLVFNYETGKALGDYLTAQRGHDARAANVIDKSPFVLAAGANILSLPGVCDS
ncbi:hypothetical protein [Phenylobacterium sp.]|uniref:hypothetical protein n=1 Tax=Phenylobacterium sp. TaxID=1871053 RepID=UPI002736D702|nr:hypothetical protein [Phenylobacterium sp.]MDP3854301.1 hypothetical protein [Phenylobacterium sp.]